MKAHIDGIGDVEYFFDHVVRERMGKDADSTFIGLGARKPGRVRAMTFAALSIPGQPPVSGEAVCSIHDNFCKRLGRAIALGRAAKAAGFTRRQRKQLCAC